MPACARHAAALAAIRATLGEQRRQLDAIGRDIEADRTRLDPDGDAHFALMLALHDVNYMAAGVGLALRAWPADRRAERQLAAVAPV